MNKTILAMIIIGSIGLLIMLGFVLELAGLQWMEYIGIRKANIERNIYEESKSYNEGMVQNLIKYKYEYDKASEDEKIIIVNSIRHMYADYDEEKIKSKELKMFLKKIKYGELE
jgi:hypothetical protein